MRNENELLQIVKRKWRTVIVEINNLDKLTEEFFDRCYEAELIDLIIKGERYRLELRGEGSMWIEWREEESETSLPECQLYLTIRHIPKDGEERMDSWKIEEIEGIHLIKKFD